VVSLTPGFSRVQRTVKARAVLTAFFFEKPFKRFSLFTFDCTGLKPGVNKNLVMDRGVV
jgi:hypothetical protein